MLNWILVLRRSAFLVLALLCACGGGGGGGTSLTVSPSSLHFSADQSGVLPAPQRVTASFSGDGLLVGYPPGIPTPSWLNVSTISGGDGSPQQFEVVPNTVSLSPGVYSTTLRFVTGHIDGSAVKTHDIPVTYTVGTGFVATSNELVFTIIDGNEIPVRAIGISKEDGKFSASSDQPWLLVTTQTQSAGGTVSVTVNTANLMPGTYLGNVTVHDDSTGRQPLKIPVTLNYAAPRLVASAFSFAFSAVSDQLTTPTGMLSLSSETTTQIQFDSKVDYQGETNNWLTVVGSGSTPKSGVVAPSTTALPPGTYNAVYTLTPARGQPAVQIPVSYTLRAAQLSAAPTSLSFLINAGTTDTQLSKALAFGDDGAALTWRLTKNVDWIKLSRETGTTGVDAGASVTIDREKLSSMKNGEYSGTITITSRSASTAEASRTISVQLSLALPEVGSISPGAIVSGSGASHLIAGRGFASMTGQKIHIGDNVVTDFSVLSDNLIRVNAPGLAAGTYDVSVDNDLKLSRAHGELIARDTSAEPAASLGRNYYRVVSSRYDPAHGVLYALSRDTAVDVITEGTTPAYLSRLQKRNGSWIEEIILSAPGIYAIELSADGNTMYVGGETMLYRLDLTVTTPQLEPLPGSSSGANYWRDVARLADDTFLLTTGIHGSGYTNAARYDAATQKATSIGSYDGAGLASSFDHGLVLLRQQNPSQFTPGIYLVNASSPAIVPMNFHDIIGLLAVDRIGQKFVINNTVYDRSQAPIATIDTGANGAAFSSDGQRLYTVTSGARAGDAALLAYDVSAIPSGGKLSALARYSIDDDAIGTPFVSLDGKTVYLISPTRFSVIPIAP